MDSYYPNTKIDTEIILKRVQADVIREQNELIYYTLKRKYTESSKPFPQLIPYVQIYEAQSPEQLFIKGRLRSTVNDEDCEHSFERSVQMLPGSNMQFQIKAICYDHNGVTERAGKVNPLSEPEKKIR